MLLEKESSILGYPGGKYKALDADHHSVCKYESPQDPNYVAVRNALQSFIAKIFSINRLNDDSSSVRSKLVSLRSSLGITEIPDTGFLFFSAISGRKGPMVGFWMRKITWNGFVLRLQNLLLSG